MPKLTKHWLGVFKSEEMVGVVTLGWGTRPLHTIQKIINEDMNSSHYLEIGKMCMLDSEPKNSETQMISQLIKWIKKNRPEVLFLYTLADGIMGKCGYVYQAANFYYGGGFWTDIYITSCGEKIHPRTTRQLCKDNWKYHYDENSEGFDKQFKEKWDIKACVGMILALVGNRDFPKTKPQVFWFTPEFMKTIGLRKIKGKMFRYIYPLNKRAKKILLTNSKTEWQRGKGVYPKEKNGDLEWKEMVARKKYVGLATMPEWDLHNVEYNKKNVNAHKKGELNKL
jgi:hypothetical protein